MLSKSLVRRLQRMSDRDHRRLYLSGSGEEGKPRGTVKTGQPMATCGGFAPGNRGTVRPNDGKTGKRSNLSAVASDLPEQRRIPPEGSDAPF